VAHSTNQHHQIYLATHYLPYIRLPELTLLHIHLRNWGSCQYSGWLRTGRPGFDPRQRIFLLVSVSRLTLGPTQPPTQWVPEALSLGVKWSQGVMLTTHPHLVPRLSMSKSYTSSLPCASVACSGQLYFYIFTLKKGNCSVHQNVG
jgi:hypothetical protein